VLASDTSYRSALPWGIPTAAAGSSLLNSREFFQAIHRRLAPGGIVRDWIASAEPAAVAAIPCALGETFPHVHAFASFKVRTTDP
jgi:spermidine synthase